MLAVQKSRTDTEKCTPNILPCKINYTGPTGVTKRFWNPAIAKDGTRVSYFRGRKLKGRLIKLPDGYEGSLWRNTNKTLPLPPSKKAANRYQDNFSSDDEEEEASDEVKIIEQISTFDDMLIWGHDQLPTDSDVFVKGVEEWIRFAEAIHQPDTAGQTNTPS